MEKSSLLLDCKASWLACVCITLASCICVGTCYIHEVFVPELLTELQIGKPEIAIPGLFMIPYLTILCPVSSAFFTRFGGRLSVLFGGVSSALGLLGSALSPYNYILFMTYKLLVAWGSCLIYMASFLIVPLYFDRHRSLATGMVSAGPGAGVLIMSPVAQTLMDCFDGRKVMLILGAINLATSVLGVAISRKVEIPKADDSQVQTKKNNCVAMLLSSSYGFQSLVKHPLLVLLVVMNVSVCLGHYMPLLHLIEYADDLGIPSDDWSWFYSIIGITSIICRVLTGKIGDTGRVSFYHTYQAGLLLMFLANFLVPMARKVEYLYVYAAMRGICEGLCMTSLYCLALPISPCGFGWLMFFTAFPIVISSPSLAGLIIDSSHSFAPMFYTAGSFLIIAFFIPYLRHRITHYEKSAHVDRLIDTNSHL